MWLATDKEKNKKIDRLLQTNLYDLNSNWL